MARLPRKAIELFNDDQAMKGKATADAAGKPHLTPKVTMMAITDESIAYSEMAGGTTEADSEATKQAALLACKELKALKATGVVQGACTSGDVFERFRKMAEGKRGLDVSNSVLTRVEEVSTGAGKKIA